MCLYVWMPHLHFHTNAILPVSLYQHPPPSCLRQRRGLTKYHTHPRTHKHRHMNIAGRVLRRGEPSFVNKELWQLTVAMGTVCCRGLVLHHKVLKLAPKPRRSHPSSTRLTSISQSFKHIVRFFFSPPVSFFFLLCRLLHFNPQSSFLISKDSDR